MSLIQNNERIKVIWVILWGMKKFYDFSFILHNDFNSCAFCCNILLLLIEGREPFPTIRLPGNFSSHNTDGIIAVSNIYIYLHFIKMLYAITAYIFQNSMPHASSARLFQVLYSIKQLGDNPYGLLIACRDRQRRRGERG